MRAIGKGIIKVGISLMALTIFIQPSFARSPGEQSTQGVQGFCGNYIQTSSNAGPCPSCKLQIADNPKLQKYFVESNNGWSAELSWVEGDASVATGSGQWKNHIAPPYGGKKIDIDMNEQGNTLTMTMSVSDRSVPGVIKVTYYCLDAHRQTGFNPAPPPKPR